MGDETKRQPIVATRRSLLSMATGVAGLVAVKQWTKPVVESVMLPAHAQTTGPTIPPPQISNLRITGDPECFFPNGAIYSSFDIEYSFTSAAGVVSHVVTAACGDDTLSVAGSDTAVGENLFNNPTYTGSFILSGNQFGGDVLINSNSLSGPIPLNCLITVILTDANGGVASALVTVEGCDEEP